MPGGYRPMRHVPIVFLLAVLASPVHAATATLDSTAALGRARDLRGAYSLMNADVLWRSFDERMKGAMGGDREKFAGVLAQIFDQTGRAFDCPSENVTRAQGLWVVTSRCQFEKSPTPLVVEFSFDDDGQVAGFWIKPDAVPYPTTHEADSTKTVLHLPFYGTWAVVWGGKTLDQNYHVVARDQRFAYDILMDEKGVTHKGDGSKNEDYYCWLKPIVAP